MAGPKAPIGSLKQHANLSARLAQSEGSSLSGPMKTAAKKHKKAAPVDEDESDSSSDSDSDGEAASDGKHLLQLAMSTPSKRKVQQTSTKPSKMPAAAAAVKPTTQTPLSEKKPSEKKPAEKKTTVPPIKKEPVAKDSSDSSSSSEDSSDSDSDSESTKAEDERKLANMARILDAKKKKNSDNSGGAIPKVEPESSSSESSDSSDSDESEGGAEIQEEAKVVKKNAKESTTSPESESESESSESESESEEEKTTESQASESEASEDSSSDEESGSEPEEADESIAIGMRNNDVASTRIPEIIGNDFHLRKAREGVDALDVAAVFARAKMEGKQLWYFTAPASIPIEVVEKLEIPLERAQKGLSILSHNGDDYGVAFEDASTSRSIKLLIPNKAGDAYGMMNRPVDQAMHLKRITQFSNDNESSTTFTQSHSITGKPARPQPANLKARFHPIGVSNGSMGKIGVDASSDSDKDVEMAQAPPLGLSPKVAGKQKEKKRKHAADDEPASSQTTGAGRSGKKVRVETHATPSTSKAAKATPVPAINGGGPKATQTPAKKKAAVDSVASSSKQPANSARKESVVPLPANFRRMSQQTPDAESRASPVKEEKGVVKKEPKGKKGKGKDVANRVIKREKSATPTTVPSKVTPIAPPGLPARLQN